MYQKPWTVVQQLVVIFVFLELIKIFKVETKQNKAQLSPFSNSAEVNVSIDLRKCFHHDDMLLHCKVTHGHWKEAEY